MDLSQAAPDLHLRREIFALIFKGHQPLTMRKSQKDSY
jgi:hypothetical protein